MERESFENEEIGKLMNDNFVNIKVDREERPDVDSVYMTFVQVTLYLARLVGFLEYTMQYTIVPFPFTLNVLCKCDQ